MKAEVKVLDGLNIEVEFQIFRSEPSAGLLYPYLDNWQITKIGGKPVSPHNPPRWLEHRLTPGDELAIENACFDALEKARDWDV